MGCGYPGYVLMELLQSQSRTRCGQLRTFFLTVNATASSDGVIALVSSISNNTFAIKVFELDGDSGGHNHHG